MTWHALKQYVRYRRKAKTRHGVHSPFVFDFIEQVLHNKARIPDEDLTGRIAAYYKIKPVYINAGGTAAIHSFEKLLPELKPDDIVIIHDIHKTAHCTKNWHKLRDHPEVKMSIDLYKTGILLFRKEFKVKQHFMLK